MLRQPPRQYGVAAVLEDVTAPRGAPARGPGRIPQQLTERTREGLPVVARAEPAAAALDQLRWSWISLLATTGTERPRLSTTLVIEAST